MVSQSTPSETSQGNDPSVPNKFPSPIQGGGRDSNMTDEGVLKITPPGKKIKKPTSKLSYDDFNKALVNYEASENDVSEFEALTNLSSRRPEIISLMPFQPLFLDSFPAKTVEGDLFDIFVESMRKLDATAISMVNDDDVIFKIIETNNKVYHKEVVDLRKTLQNFYTVYRSLSDVKKQLNITDNVYDFSPTQFVNKNINENVLDKDKILNYCKGMPNVLNIKNTLSSIRNGDQYVKDFPATKAWVMLLRECYHLISSHSFYFLTNTDIEKNVTSVYGGKVNGENEIKRVIPAIKNNGYNRVHLYKLSNVPLSGASFESIGNYNLSTEELQAAADEANAAFKKSEAEGASKAAEEFTKESIEKAATMANRNRINLLFDQTKKTLNVIDSLNANLGLRSGREMAAIFHLLTKELRFSKLYDIDKFGNYSFGINTFSSDPKSKSIPKAIFGLKDAYPFGTGIDEKYRESLLGLSYFPKERPLGSVVATNINEKVLTFELTKDEFLKEGFECGGDYFFNPELLVQFSGGNKLVNVKSGANSSRDQSGTNNVSGVNDLSVRLRSRNEDLYNRSKKHDEDFFAVLSELGGLPQKDDVFFDGDKPSIVSNDPRKFLNNVWNSIKDHVKINVSRPKTMLNEDLGARAFLNFIGGDHPDAKRFLARAFVLAMSETYSVEVKDYTNLTRLLTSGFLDGTFPYDSSQDSEVKEMFEAIIKKLEESSEVDGEQEESDTLTASGFVQKSIANEQFKRGFIISQYSSLGDFTKSVRNHQLFKKIVEVLKDVKNTFTAYALSADGKTKFSGLEIQTILLMVFKAICTMIYASSSLDIVFVNEKGIYNYYTTTAEGRDFVGEGEADENDLDDPQQIDSYKSLGVVSKDGTGSLNTPFKLMIVSKFTNDNKNEKLNINISTKDKFFKAIDASIYMEMQYLTMAMLTVSNTLSTFSRGMSETKQLLSKLDANDYLRLINYLGDPNKLSFLLKEPQLTLMLSTIEDVYQSFQDFSEDGEFTPGNKGVLFGTYYDRLTHSKKIVEILKNFFSASEFRSSKGYNKKIISIGLAQDLLKSVLPDVITGKQDDIFKISIYKMDLLNNDVVYKPKTYIFEASRYPSRVYNDVKGSINSLLEMPTRNYTMFYQKNKENTETPYWEDMSNSFDETYSFLSQTEKQEIITNHAASFLLENYIKIMTGLVINETTFNLTSQEAEALLKEYEFGTNASQVKTSMEKKKSLKSLNIGQNTGQIKKESLMSKQSIAVATKLAFQPIAASLRHLIQPKKFDRVFHIIFDPEFEVDEEKTNKYLIQQLVQKGTLKEKPRNVLLHVDVDKTPEDLTLETFFAVVESYSPRTPRIEDLSSQLIENLPESLLPKNLPAFTSNPAPSNQKTVTVPLKIGNLFKEDWKI